MSTALKARAAREVMARVYSEALAALLPHDLALSEDEARRAAEWAAIDTIGKHLWTVAAGELWDWRQAAARL